MKKYFFVMVSLFVILVGGFIFAQQSSSNVCCEKTMSGAWCQNTQEGQCDPAFRKTPTSCEATSFCKPGCCIDSEAGICSKNTPQKVCELSTGTWLDDAQCNVGQCSLGCCMIGSEASLTTLTRCKKISNDYGLETNFRTDIIDEAQCILTANGQDKGACVFEKEGEKSCRFTTRQECGGQSEETIAGTFYKDYLCSADELATNCGPTRDTICVSGKDEVYFVDSCGNPANIYDANKIYSKDPGYWQRLVAKDSSCKPNNANINSRTCGNCDYLGGSICGKGNADYGSFVCRDLNCNINGKTVKNGESWCEYLGENGNGQDAVGSRQFRHVCIQGEEVVEPCADFRNEVCVQETHPEFGNFVEAACVVNRWADCVDQGTESDCLNKDKRDCFWADGVHYDGGNGGNTKNLLDSEESKNRGILADGGICLPNNPIGLSFWEANSNAKSICSIGNSAQLVTFEKNIFGSKKCSGNCDVLTPGWVDTMNRVCVSLGDCGAHVNYVGASTDKGIIWKQNGRRKNIQTGLFENFADSGNEFVVQETVEEKKVFNQ